jgi:2-polyprenyl-6-methoxyphenol hydroxylase-like FAD-dependent oxidoreductase
VRALVVGGGIGGLATAIALARAGHEPLVFERASTLKAVGAGIALSPNAVAALDFVVRALPDRLVAAQQAWVFRDDPD